MVAPFDRRLADEKLKAVPARLRAGFEGLPSEPLAAMVLFGSHAGGEAAGGEE